MRGWAGVSLMVLGTVILGTGSNGYQLLAGWAILFSGFVLGLASVVQEG